VTDDLKIRAQGMLAALSAIMKKEGKKRGISGVIECPLCKGKLQYSIAGNNGHVWGCCATTNCLVWRQ
jgi:hypothetical protein